ncbi:MAG: Rrf2 family transcriptional regulator [Candidatus Zapsychrus exili]|nr:Rrf2 family transcriptional regulator [Candidatus Zapsychrus exili]
MRISARCDYACRALLELSLHWPSKEPLQIHSISDKQGIPIRYLVQILIQLKGEGLVASLRGKEGGYLLAVAPDKISLGQVIRSVGGSILPMADSAKSKDSIFNSIWNDVDKAMSQVIDNITFEDLCEKFNGLDSLVTYCI